MKPRTRRALARRWRRICFYLTGGRAHTCLDCGFLAFADDQEVTESDRRLISAKGSAGWWSDTPPFDCGKHLWNWEIGDHFEVITTEATCERLGCVGYRTYSHGRSPLEHFKLEDEQRVFRNQLWLAGLAFLGGLLGAVIGAFFKRP